MTLARPLALALLATALSASAQAPRQIDTDLLEISVPKLHTLYAQHKYTVLQVTNWYLARMAKYDATYNAVIHSNAVEARAVAARQDAESPAQRKLDGPLWGVPIVIKDNTSVANLVTSNGWHGYNIPGKQFIPTRDATIVARLRAAGAIILAHTNMPDFAASDTNYSTAGGRTGNAYNPRFSPGGSSGGTATSVAANFAVFGQGTDTANSIRQPAALSSLVGILPTRGLVSIAGIHPLDWLLDNTGPLARDVTTAAIALTVMAAEDPQDFRTLNSTHLAQPKPYTAYLKPDALKGKRFAVPAFILNGTYPRPDPVAAHSGPIVRTGATTPIVREAFLKAIDQMRAAGATVLIQDDILADDFPPLIDAIITAPYRAEGTLALLKNFGPPLYRTPAEYEAATHAPLPGFLLGIGGRRSAPQRTLETDPARDATFFTPQQTAYAAYLAVMEKYHLDGFVYPALQDANYDELAPNAPYGGPHSRTGWVNNIGVPAIVVPGGFSSDGMPFGLELSSRRWTDGDLIGYAFAFEQSTHNRRPPTLELPHQK